MRKQIAQSRYDENKMRVRLTVESDECHREELKSRFVKVELLRYVADDPSFSACGGQDFDTMKMYHNGVCWVMEFEAIVPRAQS